MKDKEMITDSIDSKYSLGSDNKQISNSANEEDVIKHISLVALLNLFCSGDGHLLYAETHAFRPVVDLNDSRVNEWKQSIHRLPDSGARKDYIEIETPFIQRKSYLCSTGIANHFIGRRNVGKTDILFCESGAESGDILEAQSWNATNSNILASNENMAECLKSLNRQYDLVLAHIDPYTFKDIDETIFKEWLDAFSEIAGDDVPIAVLVFNWNTAPWPAKDHESIKLRSTYPQNKMSLGLYANSSGWELVKDSLAQVGCEKLIMVNQIKNSPKTDTQAYFREISSQEPASKGRSEMSSKIAMRFLGVDVGFSKKRESLGYCAIEMTNGQISICSQIGALKGYGLNTLEDFKNETLPGLLDTQKGNPFTAIALDGPLTPDMQTSGEPFYRPQEKLLLKIKNPRRIKAQPYQSPVGRNLYQAAMELRYIGEKWGYRYEPFSGIKAGKGKLILESFPKLWLAVMFDPDQFDNIFDKNEVTRSDIDRMMAISIFKNEHPDSSTDLPRFLEASGLSLSTSDGAMEAVLEDKDITAAFVSAMGGLLSYIGFGSVLGNDEYGSFLLPGQNLWVKGWGKDFQTYNSFQEAHYVKNEPR